MGKTYRDSTASARKCIRSPKGHKAALVNGARKSAVPPSSWEDKPLNSECYVPWNLARKMYYDDGKDQDQIVKFLVKRFKMKYSDANYIFLSMKKNDSRTSYIKSLPKSLEDL